jgi:hypothetical protein
MRRITILVRDEQKTRSLLDLLQSLDFVSIIEIEGVPEIEVLDEASRAAEFWSAAGIWEGRDVTTDSLRKESWLRQTKR